MASNKRHHVWKAARPALETGNDNARRHGMKAAAFFARRKQVNDVLRAAREHPRREVATQ